MISLEQQLTEYRSMGPLPINNQNSYVFNSHVLKSLLVASSVVPSPSLPCPLEKEHFILKKKPITQNTDSCHSEGNTD